MPILIVFMFLLGTELNKYLPTLVLHFPTPDKFTAMMYEDGFAEVKHKAFIFGICRIKDLCHKSHFLYSEPKRCKNIAS